MEKPRFVVDYDKYLRLLWEANPEICDLLKQSPTLAKARDALYSYLERAERDVFALDNRLHILEKATVRDCVQVFKSIIGPINEKRTGVSALDCLWKLARNKQRSLKWEVSVGFLMEFINLFRGVIGKANIYREHEAVQKGIPDFLRLKGREAAEKRSERLDEMAAAVHKYFKRYPWGLDEEVVEWRKENRERILRFLGAKEEDWYNYKWHIRNVFRKAEDVFAVIQLPQELKESVARACANHLPFGITPYYLSLMDYEPSIGYDHAVRAQVLPPPDYVDAMTAHRKDRSVFFDFMGEHDTSPADLITRRYPLICIIKPYNTCPQICVYCQRNWEIDECLSPRALATKQEMEAALKWIAEHNAIGDVLVTGGDPGIMSDYQMEKLLDALAKMEHIYRIRIGTRTLVTLPFRWTDKFVKLMAKYHRPGRREIAVVTHAEHSYEITPEMRDAVQKLRRRAISVYNQEVYTIENSRRFETAKLRRDLKAIGIDPYYNFNMKGKLETMRYMVPIARIVQERKEEARLLPGLDRTDESVFNVPKLGKNHLRAFQDRRLVMIRPDGSRVYEFHPWEKNITPVPPYNYVDVPIYSYLEELAARGENMADYRTIWFYY
ncbi:MAG: KamA family radical SAM protein [Planctomycetales bacterium 4484_113]|nr:MAG: KamA family radical SAM protein [Planctomycetales bacterium 4484_113]